MLSSSLEFKQAIRENTKCTISSKITFKDGRYLDLTGSDFMANTTSFDEATSASGTFEIGAAIMKTFSCVLNNMDGKFNGYDFTDAEMVPIIRKQLSSSEELIPKGTYYVEQPNSIGKTITITAYDKMRFFEKSYKDVSTIYPATLQTILNDVCTYCGVALGTQRFDNYDFVVQTRPDDETLSCLDVVSFVAQIAGSYAKVNVSGYLELSWYDADAFIDGGTFNTATTPYSDGSNLDGGNFTDYTTGNFAEGGLFTDPGLYQIYAFSNFQICTDDVMITGLKTVVDETEYLHGAEGYVLSLENNAFITIDNMKVVAELVGNKVIQMRFRPFSVSALSDPTLESGDAIWLVKDGEMYGSYITHTNYKMGNYQTFECTAKTPSANVAAKYSAETQSIVKAKNETKKQISAYDVQIQLLTQLMANSFGVFKTTEEQDNGSFVYYMHDKPTLDASTKIWKMTADAFAVSTDGGKTWNAGIDANGNAVVNVLSAIGINASWINAGSILIGGTKQNTDGSIDVYDVDGKTLFSVNKDKLIVNTTNFKIQEDGNIDVTGNITSKNGYALEYYDGAKPPKAHQYSFVETYVDKGGVPYLRLLAPRGNEVFRCGLEIAQYGDDIHVAETPIFDNGIFAEYAWINSVQGFTTNISGTNDNGFSVSGTIIMSGIFVSMYGSLIIESIEAGETLSCALLMGTERGFAPLNQSVQTVTYYENQILTVSLGCDGMLYVKNHGARFDTTGSPIAFRLDYFRM